MLIKKRWAWLMSVMLLGFLARADGREGSGSLSTADPFVMGKIKKDLYEEPILKPTGECIKGEDPSKKPVYSEIELTSPKKKVIEPEKDIKALSEENEPTEQLGFPYAIDSSPSITHVSAMLSYCVYHESLSMDECREFWKQSCDQDAFHQFQLGGLNAVTICKNEDRVYVAFAGTQSWNDSIVDANVLSRMMESSKKNLFGHGGFIGRARQYGGWVREKLLSIEGINQKELVLTGHSLGAALATLLAHEVYEGLELNVQGGVSNSLNQVKVIGFGSPSALLDPNNYFLGHLNHLRFYNPNDPVATTLAWLSGYGHVGVQFAIPDGPSRHIVRAAPLLSKQKSLKLLRQLPQSYWSSLPPLVRSRLDLGIDAHSMYSYAILADTTFADYQKQRRTRLSVTALSNVEKAVGKRIGALVDCSLENGKVICFSGGKVVAKFRYAIDAPPTGQEVDACMSSIVNTNFVPGVTVNAGMSIVSNMSPITAASEALILDISKGDKWYEQMPSGTFASLYLDGHSPLPTVCDRKPTLLEPAKTLPTERTLVRKFVNAPRLFTLARDYTIPADKTVNLIQADYDFFSDARQDGWMDCRLPENSAFCPVLCKRNDQACAMMKHWGTNDQAVDYWVSLSKDSNLKWVNSNDSWKFTITEKGTGSWIPYWRSQNQATFMVVRDDYEGYLQFSG